MNTPTYYFINHYKIRPVKIKNAREVCNGMFTEYRIKCLDGAEEYYTVVGGGHLYDSEKEAIPKLLEILNDVMTTYKEKLEEWGERKEYYESKLKEKD